MSSYTPMQGRYPYLPEGRNILYVPVENPFMAEACNVRNMLSTDSLHPTGAVVVKDGKIVGRGANQSAFKHQWLIELHKKGWCIRRFLKIPSGQKYWLCPGCSSSRHHAETRAVKDALKQGVVTQDSDLYLYGHWWCCKPCWDSMIQVGIRDVYLVDNADVLFRK